ADNFFWLGRYAERAEAIARIARVICLRLADRGRRAFASNLAPLVAALEAQAQVASGQAFGQLETPVARPSGSPLTEPLRGVRKALFDVSHAGTLAATGRAIDRVARSVRDRLSIDSWSVVVALAQELGEAERAAGEEPLLVLAARLDRTIMAL